VDIYLGRTFATGEGWGFFGSSRLVNEAAKPLTAEIAEKGRKDREERLIGI